MQTTEQKVMIGCEEWLALPDLAIPAIKARIDSGAKTSSIHAFNIESFWREQQQWVRFEVHPLQRKRNVSIHCVCPVVDKRNIKSSNGEAHKRYVIESTMHCGDRNWKIELTLANRDSMGYRMLLGREAMIGRLTVDPQLSFCLGAVESTQLISWYGKKARNLSGVKNR